MSPVRTLLNLLIIAAGPLVTIFLFRDQDFDASVTFASVIFLLFLGAVTAAVSAAMHLMLKLPK